MPTNQPTMAERALGLLAQISPHDFGNLPDSARAALLDALAPLDAAADERVKAAQRIPVAGADPTPIQLAPLVAEANEWKAAADEAAVLGSECGGDADARAEGQAYALDSIAASLRETNCLLRGIVMALERGAGAAEAR